MSQLDQPTSPRLPAVVLAAGLSTRMGGRFKPLLPVAGRPLIARTLAALFQVPEISRVLLITGHRADAVCYAAGGYDVVPVHNPDYEAGGMVSSAQAGVRALPEGVDGFVLSLGDQPAVRPETISRLIAAWRKGAATIAVPAYHGKRGHPVVLSIRCAADILRLQPGQTLKTVVERYKEQSIQVDVDDPGVVVDVDTPDDYERLLKSWNEPIGAGHAPNER
jgi:molybdenum cofactor cytidylyltransferase